MMIGQRLLECTKLSWRLLRQHMQMLYGAWRVSGLPKPIITIFGGSRLPQEDKYAQQAQKLAQMLVHNGISIVTGGGAGIMQAASCGSEYNGKNRSLGIGVKDLDEGKNPCQGRYFEMDDFSTRKWLLSNYSAGIVVFPGGFGTLDELSEVLTLIQTGKRPALPIVLIGTEYWNPFIEWFTNETLGHHNFIIQEHLQLFTVTDDLEKAVHIICKECLID